MLIFFLLSQTFYEDPAVFFLFFSKAIGGDMVGLWALLFNPVHLKILIF